MDKLGNYKNCSVCGEPKDTNNLVCSEKCKNTLQLSIINKPKNNSK